MHVVLEVFVRDVHGFKYTHGELGAAFAGIDVPCLRRLDALHGISYAVPERVIRNPATLSRTCKPRRRRRRPGPRRQRQGPWRQRRRWQLRFTWGKQRKRVDSVVHASDARCNIHGSPVQPAAVYNAGIEITCCSVVPSSSGHHESTACPHTDLKLHHLDILAIAACHDPCCVCVVGCRCTCAAEGPRRDARKVAIVKRPACHVRPNR
mmetsp:Transcript_42118/g.126055  ORF Transcript_42118/g.126055 Transcript_42118/m.126055 type:complete len:208 (+) Transcript_42118:1959-2582(+)